MDITYVGAWRAGTDGHFLWQNTDWAGFQAKWNELSGQGFRLARITTFLVGGQRRWTGSSGARGISVTRTIYGRASTGTASRPSGTSCPVRGCGSWTSALRRQRSRSWAGVWRAGSSALSLGVRVAGLSGQRNELSGQGLRLVTLDTYMSGSTCMWVGAWRAGSDGHYLWAGVDWDNFTTKRKQLGSDGLRLTDLATYVEGGQRKWAGIWRAGTDAYELWGPISRTSSASGTSSAKSGAAGRNRGARCPVPGRLLQPRRLPRRR